MFIRIYQINLERDEKRVCFLSHTSMTLHSGSLDSSIYDLVFTGDVECENLNEIFEMFNIEHPYGYKARSMSVSDVIEIVKDFDKTNCSSDFFFVDSIGFKKVEFDTRATKKSPHFCEGNTYISALLVESLSEPRKIRVKNDLKTMQKLVGGDIETVSLCDDSDSDIVLVCNEEGKISGLPLNRALYSMVDREITYSELKERFKNAEASDEHMIGLIVFSKDSFAMPYSDEERTYIVSSNNKAFQKDKNGYSILGYCADGKDPGVRLDMYMADEHGGKNGWKIEKCIVPEESRSMIMDVIAGPFFIVSSPTNSEHFQSLSESQMRKYHKKFLHPEVFSYDSEHGILMVTTL